MTPYVAGLTPACHTHSYELRGALAAPRCMLARPCSGPTDLGRTPESRTLLEDVAGLHLTARTACDEWSE